MFLTDNIDLFLTAIKFNTIKEYTMSLKKIFCFLVALSLMTPVFTGQAAAGAEKISFNDHWKFSKGESEDACWRLSWNILEPFLLQTGNDLVKNGEKINFKSRSRPGDGIDRVWPSLDDSTWQKVTLPHDFAIYGPFSRTNDPRDTYLPCTEIGWYRKTFTLPQAEKDARFYLDFDGVMSHCAVWVNAKLVGGWGYGYTSFRLDITPYLNKDRSQPNLVAVRVARPPMISRWYTGAGIYRNVYLTIARPVHFAHWGLFVSTPNVSDQKAEIRVSAELQNESAQNTNLTVKTKLFKRSPNGSKEDQVLLSGAPLEINLKAGETQKTDLPLLILNQPRLWRLESPDMYVLRAEIYQGSQLLDQEDIPFGIRSLRYDPNLGFFLNGKKTVIKGVCLHHDLGALGAAVNVRATERQLELLKESGCNAIRLSHNPSSPEQLDLLDRMGFLVQAEAFDEWKRLHEYSVIRPYTDYFDNWHERDLRALIRRDRNHPSVIMYSVGNEIPELTRPDEFVAIASKLQKIVKQEDTTRPTTSANNYGPSGINEIARVLDIFGYNYFGRKMYPLFHQKNPDKFVYGSEIVSVGSSRGEYFFPLGGDSWSGVVNYQENGYGVSVPGFNPAKPLESWAAPPDYEFKAMDEYPFVGGCFIWSGFDYLGAPGMNDTIARLSNLTDPKLKKEAEAEIKRVGIPFVPLRICKSGLFDTAGFHKDSFYLYQSYWRPNYPMAHLLPHWNWPDRRGEITPVHLFTSGDEAELFLNDQSLGRRKKGKFEYRLKWEDVQYEPGTLKAVVYKNGKFWCSTEIKTTGAPAAVRLKADRNVIKADGKDLAFVTVEIVDKNGLIVPNANLEVRLKTEGAGRCVATDNGDGCDWTSYQSPDRKTFNGLLLAVFQAVPKQSGDIKIKASANGLTSCELTVKAQ